MKRFISIILTVFLLGSTVAVAESATAALMEMYAEAELLMAQGDYSSAASKFEALGTYSDASQMAMYAKAIMAAETLNMYDVAVSAFEGLDDFKDSKQMAVYYTGRSFQYTANIAYETGIENQDVTSLQALADFYKKARDVYSELALFKDSITRMADCEKRYEEIEKLIVKKREETDEATYQKALGLENEGKYADALKVFETITHYKDSAEHITAIEEQINEAKFEGKYQTAASLEETGQYAKAWKAFKELDSYKDSLNRAIDNAKHLMDSPNAVYTKTSYIKNGVTTFNYGCDTTYIKAGDNIEVNKINWEEDKDVKERESYTIVPGASIYTGTKSGAWSRTSGTLWSKSKETYSSKTEYDEHHNLIRETKIYKAVDSSLKNMNNVKVVYTYEYEYDEYGNILTQKEYEDGEYKRTYIFEYEYNGDNQIIMSTRVMNSAKGTKNTQVSTYTYDTGLLICEEHPYVSSEGTIVRTEYTYE